jgi:hypothetical protein
MKTKDKVIGYRGQGTVATFLYPIPYTLYADFAGGKIE